MPRRPHASKQAGMAETNELAVRLGDLLERVHRLAPADFAGVGVVVTADDALLPVVPLRAPLSPLPDRPTAEILADIASEAHPLHDGFHILSPGLALVAISQYFSPPIVAGVDFDRSRDVGGRFVAALFGSCLPAVILTGVVGRGAGLSVFHRGSEILRETLT